MTLGFLFLGGLVTDFLGRRTPLLPQAGVVLGMALVSSQRFPDLSHALVSGVVASTALLELVGPILTRVAVRRAGEAEAQTSGGIA
jgi:hypothetical protein